ncbi:MAG: ChaN family lipoprotein [Myxococcota bacterium]|nr:ChaN family lipoprotein [Myxococcota bacterium]
MVERLPPRSVKKRGNNQRSEVVQLHREIFRRNQIYINSMVKSHNSEFHKYEERYRQHTQTYQKKCHIEQLEQELAQRRFVCFGDYHTLAQAQRSFLRFLRRVPKERPLTLALEWLEARHQKHMDTYLDGKITLDQLFEFVSDQNSTELNQRKTMTCVLEHAKASGHKVIGIERSRKTDRRYSLQARDKFAARIIARAMRRNPKNQLWIFTGEMHIIPPHLPHEIQTLVPSIVKNGGFTSIYQNAEEIYWDLESKGQEHDTEIVRIKSGQYCIINTLPIVSQQSFLTWLDTNDSGQPLEGIEENFLDYIRSIERYFDLEIGEAIDQIQVTTVADLSFLEDLSRGNNFSDADIRMIKEQILSSESYYIPRIKMAYLGNLSINHAAEEATHFIRHICSGCHEPKRLVDAFYARTLEEAIGFMGSKLLNHKRKCPHNQDLEKIRRSRYSTHFEKELARLCLKHARFEEGKRTRKMVELYEVDAEMFNALTHTLGYQLGDKLFYGLMSGLFAKQNIRVLFFDHFEEENSALETYFYLSEKARFVAIPERL